MCPAAPIHIDTHSGPLTQRTGRDMIRATVTRCQTPERRNPWRACTGWIGISEILDPWRGILVQIGVTLLTRLFEHRRDLTPDDMMAPRYRTKIVYVLEPEIVRSVIAPAGTLDTNTERAA